MKRTLIATIPCPFDGESVNIFLGRFIKPKNLCVFAEAESGQPYDRMTVNVDKALQGCVLLRSWQINPSMKKAMLDTGIFTPTGIMIPQGFVEGEIWRVDPEWEAKVS